MAELYERPGRFEAVVSTDGKEKAEYLNERAFTITAVPSQSLIDLFNECDITRRGKFAWAVSDTPEGHAKFSQFFRGYSYRFTPETLHSAESASILNRMFFEVGGDMVGPQTLAITQIELKRSVFEDPYYANPRNRAYMPRANVKESVRSFFMGHDNAYQIPRAIVMGDVHAEYVNMRSHAALTYGDKVVFRDNFSPFVIALEKRRDTLWIRLKFVNYDDRSGDILPSYSQYRGSFRDTAVPALGELGKKVGGLHYLGSKTTNVSTLFMNEFLELAAALNTKYGDNVFTEDSLALVKEMEEIGNKSLLVSNSFSDPNRADVINASNARVNYANEANKSIGNWIEPYGKITMSVKGAVALNEAVKSREIIVHPALFDLQNMINADDYMGEDRLYGYQRRAVGLQLSTQRGFVNSLDTGIGKSVVQLTAMRERAKNTENYRGIIACQSNTIKQWKEYMHDDAWFPEATIAVVNSGKKLKELEGALATEGPVVVLITFNMLAQVTEVLDARNEFKETVSNLTGKQLIEFLQTTQGNMLQEDHGIGEILVDSFWHDVCADEATAIRNDYSSKQSRALWQIRSNSEVGTALTATPFNKSITDIERLLGWVRNDRRLFHGASLAGQYDQENITEDDAKKIFNTLYPMVFRFTKEEAVAEEKEKIQIPEELEPVTLLLKPTAAEHALSQACEYELKRIITELEEALNNYEAKTTTEKAELEAAREELRNAHGHWLSGTNIARMATSNPASILKSSSLAAQLLVGQGLVEAAMQEVPTKQRKLMELAAKNVEDGKQILVFTDFVDVADTLAEAFDKIGIRAGVFGGKNGKKRDENRIAFQRGDLDVLVCTKAAERGLTLHRASVTYHYDLSWTLEPLLQKAGRAARVGSDNESVETYFLVLEGTIEEKVVKQVFTQGTLSSMVLDKARGVDIKNTTTGKLMGGLMNASTNINTRKGAIEFGKALLG